MRLLRVIILLLLAGFVGLAVYAYFGDMSADPGPMRVPVELDLGQPAATSAPGDQPALTPAAAAPAAAAPASSAPAAPASAAESAPDEAPPTNGNSDASLD